MKKSFLAIIASLALLSCTDTKKQEKDLLDQVIAIHDKVMAGDEQLMKNKMLLDSLAKTSPAAQKDSIIQYSALVNKADSSMTDWMHKFDAENKGKSHQEIMDYLAAQKIRIILIDAQVSAAVNGSNTYLAKIQSK